MNFNKKIWWIPVVGIIYVFRLGFKYGFYTEFNNPLKLWEGIIGSLIHAFVIMLPLFILILI